MLTVELDSLIGQTVNVVSNAVEQETQVIVPPEVRSFLNDLLRETFILRQDDWKAAGMPVDNAENVKAAMQQMPVFLRDRVSKVLYGAAEVAYYDVPGFSKRLSIIDVIDWFREHWCEVFPICR